MNERWNSPPEGGTWRHQIGLLRPSVVRTGARWTLVGGAVCLAGWIMWQAGATLTPFLLGLVLAYVLLPIVEQLDRYLPRWASIATVYLVGLALLAGVVVVVIPVVVNQASQFMHHIPEWTERGTAWVTARIAAFQRTASPEVQEHVTQQVGNLQAALQRNVTTYGQQVGTVVLNSVISIFATLAFLFGFLVIPFFLFYILLDTRKLPNAIDSLLHAKVRDDVWNIWRIIDGILGRYIRGVLILGAVVAAGTFLGLQALNLLFGFTIPFTVVLALLAGIGELILVVGPILAAIPAIIVAIGDGPSAIIAVIVLYILIQQLENQILVPRIIGNTLRLHPAVLLAGLVIAGAVGGLVLLILAGPLLALSRDVFIYLHRRVREPPQSPDRAVVGLLPAEQAPRPTEGPDHRVRRWRRPRSVA